ncbi:MAG: CopG family transcriptional regulator [Bifidobacteriaceae bacterium]|jgi:hypothetical protein|nr:CopG family transcriptional regulator [Bifidobacteriaceae bacterium]
MRTTVRINDRLLAQAKSCAARQGLSLGGYLEEAIRRDLLRAGPKAAAVDLPAFPAGKPRPGVDLLSNQSLFEAMDHEGTDA